MQPVGELYAVGPDGPTPLALAPGVRQVNEVFEGLELGIYEALRTFGHARMIGLAEHLGRAQASMDRLGWDERLDREGLRRALRTALEAAPFDESRVRFDVLPQPARELGSDARTLLALAPLDRVPEAFVREGVGVPLIRDLRRERPLIKEAEFVIRRRRFPSGGQDAYEPMMVDERGRILEGISSSFCGVRGRALCTCGEDVLEGVTVRLLARLAAERGIAVRHEAVLAEEAGTLDEAFLCSSVRGVVPIVRIDGRELGAGTPGAVTTELRLAYDGYCEREAQPA